MMRRRFLVLGATCGALLAVAAPAFAYWTSGAATTSSASATSLQAVSTASASAIDATHATVSWTPPAGQPTGTTYTVTSGANTYCTNASGSSCTASGLSAGSSYTFSVTPKLGLWVGPSASAAQITTPVPSLTLSPATATTLPATLTGTATAFPVGDALSWRLDTLTGTVLTGTSVMPAGGAVSVTVPAGTANGPHTVFVIAGSLNASTPVTVTTVAPPTSVSLTNGGGIGNAFVNIANKSSVNFSVGLGSTSKITDTVHLTVTDGTSTVTATNKSGTAGAGTLNFTGLNLTSLADGTLTAAAWVTNASGQSVNTTITITKDVVAPTVTAIVSANGDGKLATGDSLTITFSEALNPSSFSGSSANVHENRANGAGKTVFLTIDQIAASSDTGSTTYVGSGNGGASANYTSTLALSGSTVVVTVGTVISGSDPTNASSGPLAFTPATTILDRAGNPITATFTTASGFKLF